MKIVQKNHSSSATNGTLGNFESTIRETGLEKDEEAKVLPTIEDACENSKRCVAATELFKCEDRCNTGHLFSYGAITPNACSCLRQSYSHVYIVRDLLLGL